MNADDFKKMLEALKRGDMSGDYIEEFEGLPIPGRALKIPLVELIGYSFKDAFTYWLNRYDALPLECDGMSRVIHTVLLKNQIPHSYYTGRVVFAPLGCTVSDVKFIYPHHWLVIDQSVMEIGGLYIDYRARMWLGSSDVDIPHGIFNVKNYLAMGYEGRPVQVPPLADHVFEIMTKG